MNSMKVSNFESSFHTIDLNGKPESLWIWDHEQEQFIVRTRAPYKLARGILLVYDVTYKQSFNEKEWLNDYQIQNNAKENVVKILVGNKVDLKSKREVTPEEGKQLADSLNIPFIGSFVNQ